MAEAGTTISGSTVQQISILREIQNQNMEYLIKKNDFD